jgi:hypothetical protein
MLTAVPIEPTIASTLSLSTSLRVCSIAFGGLNASSSAKNVIFLPFMPPLSLIMLK